MKEILFKIVSLLVLAYTIIQLHQNNITENEFIITLLIVLFINNFRGLTINVKINNINKTDE